MDKKGEAPIELTVSICRKRVVIQLPYRTKPETFKQKRPPQELVNYLDAQRIKIRQIMSDMTQMGIIPTSTAFRDYFRAGGVKSYMVSDLLCDFLKMKKSSKVSQQLFHKYEFVSEIFQHIIGQDKEVEHITNDDVRRFVGYVETKYMNSTAVSYYSMLMGIIRYAMDNGRIIISPLQKVKIARKPSKIDYLTEEEIDKIRKVKLDTDSLNKIRDCALFQISSGLAYCDCVELTEYDLQEKEGTHYISKLRHKTGTPFFAVVLPDGVDIYNRYNGKIPFISNQKYNLFLKVLAERAGINKNFHTHLFRHTYCTLLLNKGVSMKTVSRCAGHSSSLTTESFYAFLKEETILEEVSKAIEKLDF